MLVNTNHPGYVKDTKSGVIINTDTEEYKKFLAAREANKNSKNLQRTIEDVQRDLKEIKSLLLQIVNRNY